MPKGCSTLFVGMLGALIVGCGSPGSPGDHVVARWLFDEGAGTLAIDSSGHQNNAVILNGTWGDGHVGSALLMNGGNDSIATVTLSDSLRSTTDEITVMAWTYRTATHNVAVLSHGYPALFFGFHGARYKWQIEHVGGRRTACYADPKFEAQPDRWIHLAATYDGWVARLYADGAEVCSKWAWGAITMPEAPFTISGYLDASGHIVDEITGRLDDVRIYDRALSQQDIRQIAGLAD
jgi:hypothetical protein